MKKKYKKVILIAAIPIAVITFLAFGIGGYFLYRGYRTRHVNHHLNPGSLSTELPRPDFSYTTPYTAKTQSGLKAGVKLGSQKISTQDGKSYMLLTLQGEDIELPDSDERPPLNLSIVIDRSGSMSGDKLNSVRQALISISSMLDEKDHVSIVAYDDTVQTIYEPQSFDAGKFKNKIRRINSGGSTYLEGGLKKGITHTQSLESTDYLNKVILLSDGLANVGISDPELLSAQVQDLVKDNIVVSTIGVGTDYDDKLMSSVAIAGNGNYYFMESPSQAESIFAQELQNTISTIAKDIEVEINLQDNYQLVRGIGYELESKSSFEANNIYAGRTTSYLFELKGEEINVTGGKYDIGEIFINFSEAETGDSKTIKIPVEAEIVAEKVEPLEDDEVYFEYVDAIVGEELWEVYERLDQKENDVARNELSSLIDLVEQANDRLDNAFENELAELESKQDYLKNLGDSFVNESSSGRSFQKSNQKDAYDKVYNK